MKPYHLLLIVILLLSCFAWLPGRPPRHERNRETAPVKKPSIAIPKELKEKASEAKRFAQQQDYNDRLCFLVNMSLPSGQHRFFVYDLKKDTLLNQGLVTHGRCNQDWLEGRKYGNTPGCGCTSLGKYRIGYPYNGRFGLAYKLYGLDKTNDKAFSRFVVLHSHECVPDATSGEEICQSDGCPTVAPTFLQYLKPVIDRSEKPVLLWIFE